jgi:hypothetical protein
MDNKPLVGKISARGVTEHAVDTYASSKHQAVRYFPLGSRVQVECLWPDRTHHERDTALGSSLIYCTMPPASTQCVLDAVKGTCLSDGAWVAISMSCLISYLIHTRYT